MSTSANSMLLKFSMLPKNLGSFESSIDAWDQRIQAGQAGGGMSSRFSQVGRKRVPALCRLDGSDCWRRVAERYATKAAR